MAYLWKFWELWKKFGHFMGDLVGRLFLMLFYFTLLLPFGIGVSLWSDPLAIREQIESRWLERKTTADPTLEQARRLW